jgi:tetratricopeptide (TPR) repeat protein
MQPGSPPFEHAEALQRAMFAVQRQDWVEAERIAGSILKTSADQPHAAKVLGYALMKQGRPAEAVAPLEKAARLGADPELETQLAIALRLAGNNEKALSLLQGAIKKAPFPPAFHELGYLLHSLGRSDEAVAALEQGIAAAPTIAELHIQLGFICTMLHDRQRARRAFARAIEINAGHLKALQGMTSVLMDEGDYAGAADLLRRALAVNPNDVSAQVALGSCLLELGKADEAYDCLRKAHAKGGQPAYGDVLQAAVSSGHGRFWLRPSAAAKFFGGDTGRS